MNKLQRFDFIDVLRGFAFVQMFFFHFCFMLYEFNLAFENFVKDPWWLHFRTLIVSQFLTLMGVSLKLATQEGLNLSSYLKRLLQLFVYGWVIVLVTYLIAPSRFVVFGILQFIFVASIVGLACLKFGGFNLLIAIFCIAFGNLYQAEFFNHDSVHWLGFMTHKPLTVDYVPLFPWFGMVLIGLWVGDWILSLKSSHRLKSWQVNNVLVKSLALFGRHSLNLYMLHMPAIFAIVFLIAKMS